MTGDVLSLTPGSLGFFVYRLFGFLLGATLAGSGSYYYILQDYKASNELLQDDIYVRYRICRFFCLLSLLVCSLSLRSFRNLGSADIPPLLRL